MPRRATTRLLSLHSTNANGGQVSSTGMLFGVYNYDKTVVIHNRGSAPTWVRGVFTAMGPSTVQNPKLIHGDAFVRVLYTHESRRRGGH